MTRARSPTKASRRKLPGPTSLAAPTVVRPSRCVLARMSVSRPDLDAPVHVGRLGVLDGDAGEHEALEQAPAHGGVDDGELDARVDAHAHLRVVGLEVRLHRVPGVEQQVDDVGEVQLALGVVAPQALAAPARRASLRNT